MADVNITLFEIRSKACNKILIGFTAFAALALALSLFRAIDYGWQPIMAVHITLFVWLMAITLFRQHLSLAHRAGTVTVLLFLIGIAGLSAFGLGNVSILFVAASAIFAASFFGQRIAFVVLGIGVLTTLAVHLCHDRGLLPPPADLATYSRSTTAWLNAATSLILAAGGAILAHSAVQEALDRERERADKASNARSEFLAHISHELRTPMTGIIGMSELLSGTPLNNDQTTINARLMRSARNLLDLLNDVLDFSKIDAGRLDLDIAPFSIAEVVNEVISLFATAAAERGLRLDTHIASIKSDWVLGDSHRLAQILTNLISNAIKFTADGSITIDVSQEELPDRRYLLRIAVIDTGIGISDEQLEHLFQPFSQADTSTSRRYGGSGLGLVISMSLAEAMSGSISVSSLPGHGSTFTVEIPVDAATGITPPEPIPPPPADAATSTKTVKRLRILVAEDDPTIRFLISNMLGRMGYSLTVVDDGARSVLSARSNHFDIIIMDMRMPVMDGPDAMRSIRAFEKNSGSARRVPIIALTADLVPEHEHTFIDAGADLVVGKPIDWALLQSKIELLTQQVSPDAPLAPDRIPNGGVSDPVRDAIANLRVVMNEDAVRHLIARFEESADEYRQRIESAQQSGDAEAAKRAAHSIKGLALQFGGVDAGRTATTIETRIAASQDISFEIIELETNLKNLKTDIARELERGT